MKKLLALFVAVSLLAGCSMFGGTDSDYELSYTGHDNLGNEYVITYGEHGVIADITTVIGGNSYELSDDGFAITTEDGQTLKIAKVEK